MLLNLHHQQKSADHTSPALECLEGSVRPSWVIFLRWHHIMTQKPALTRNAVFKLRLAPENKICCGGESILSDFKHSKGLLSAVLSHQRVVSQCVCVCWSITYISTILPPLYSQACCCSVVLSGLTTAVTFPVFLWHTWMTQFPWQNTWDTKGSRNEKA